MPLATSRPGRATPRRLPSALVAGLVVVFVAAGVSAVLLTGESRVRTAAEHRTLAAVLLQDLQGDYLREALAVDPAAEARRTAVGVRFRNTANALRRGGAVVGPGGGPRVEIEAPGDPAIVAAVDDALAAFEALAAAALVPVVQPGGPGIEPADVLDESAAADLSASRVVAIAVAAEERSAAGRPGRIALALVPTLVALLVAARLAPWPSRRSGSEPELDLPTVEQVASVFSASPTASLIVDDRGRIDEANDVAAILFGYTTAELRGRSVEELVPARLRSDHVARRRSFHAAPGEHRSVMSSNDVAAVRRDGTEVPVEVSLTLLETREGPRVIAAVVDLTERRNAERELQDRAEKLQRSNEELDQFAYVAAHDIRSPLRSIEQLAAFVVEDAGHLLPTSSRDDLDLLAARARRLQRLLNGLLDYARLGQGDRSNPVRATDLDRLFRELDDLYLPEGFHIEVPDGLPSLVATPGSVELVFRNLVMNAVKHHDRDRGRIVIGCEVAAGRTMVSVSDDGPGIPPEAVDEIFQLFRTLQPKDDTDSTGLGLALVAKVLGNQGGDIVVVPSEGRGASFVTTWPTSPSATPAPTSLLSSLEPPDGAPDRAVPPSSANKEYARADV